METRHYQLYCSVCNKMIDDDGITLTCVSDHSSSLLTTVYAAKQFQADTSTTGISRYQQWLPITHALSSLAGTITYRSKALSRILGLTNLWIAFNGYWPERGATLETASFKDLEAYTVLARIPENCKEILVVSSAGNTAAAFASLCSSQKIPCLIIIPASGMAKMKFNVPLNSCVQIVSLIGNAAYSDAIFLADRVSQLDGFFSEGGVKNVARRDGIAITLLNAVEAIGHLPDYYFQAIGSGTGGIAVHDTAKKLLDDGRFGKRLPRLMLSQNAPFAPVYDSWKSRRRDLIIPEKEKAREQIRQTIAPVLSNQRPPYAIKGGIFDALLESQGDVFIANNREALAATRLLEETEGIDIEPAAGVALATLIKAFNSGQIEEKATVLLHITGGGWLRRQRDETLHPASPVLELNEQQIMIDETLQSILHLFPEKRKAIA